MTVPELQQFVYDFLYDKKLPHISICAVMGNITGESSWNPNSIEVTTSPNKGFGLCQWTAGRRTLIEAYGAKKGSSPPTVQQQCEFLWSELTGENLQDTGASAQWIADPHPSVDNGEGFYCSLASFRDGTGGDISFLTKAFCYCWERPAFATNHLDSTRIPAAKNFYSTMSYKGSGSVPDQPDTPDPPDQPEESKTTSYLYIGSKTYTPHIFINGKWKSVTPYLKTTSGWICGATTEKEDPEVNPNPTPTPVDPSTIWTRRSRPEDNNPYYNRVGTKQGALSTCILGSPNASTLNVLRNCVGAAWGGYNETWAKNAPNNGPPGGFCAKPVDAHRTLDECMTDPVLKEYVVYSRDIKDPDNYVPPLGGIIVYSNQHVVYVSHVFDKDNIEIQQSSWGGLRGGEGPEGSPWYNSDNGLWGITKVKRNGATKNLWWFQSGDGAGRSCLGFVKNPAFLYDENGNCIGKRY